MEQVDCVVIGAGVVGLSVARALALQGREVMVLEAASAIGTGTSSRNSEVIHAGIYYPKGSLKARLCVKGKQILYDYCEERGIGHRRCGKLIVATSAAQVVQLQAIIEKAAANGVHDLVLLTRDEARALEPALECMAAVHSPVTGIVDSHALMLSLQGDLENAGGMVAFNSSLAHVVFSHTGALLTTVDGTELNARTLVNAAEALLKNGATEVSAYISHAVLSGGAVSRIQNSRLKSLVITDSILPTEAVRAAKNIRVISIAPLIGEAILRTSREESVSSLFY